MGPGETNTWIINMPFRVVMGQLELILYDMPSSFLVDYEKERNSESLSILELCVRRPPAVRQFNTYGEESTPNKRWGFARLDVVDLGNEIKVDLKTKDLLYPDEVEAPLNYLIEKLGSYQETFKNSKPMEKDLTNKPRKGGPRPTSEEKKLEYVEGWLDAQGIETQEGYCDRIGVAPSTLRMWRRELVSAGKLPPS